MSDVRLSRGEVSDLTVATNPPLDGLTAVITALYGIDGMNTGADEAENPLVFPVSMDEGAPGVYSTKVNISNDGAYWAQVTIGTTVMEPVLIRVVPPTQPTDAVADVSITVGAAIVGAPASVELSLFDEEGSSVGHDNGGTAHAWPLAMTQVVGHADSWYFEDVAFDEANRVQMVLDPAAGPTLNDVLIVGAPAPGVISHFNAWEPEEAFNPSAWVSVAYIRHWTGWPKAKVSDKDVRDLRRHAVETFIEETNQWIPGWLGTFYSMKTQGSRLYLPMPIILPQDGGIDPCVQVSESRGDQTVVEDISNDNLAYFIRGRDAKQPYVERYNQWWNSGQNRVVRIRATWGSVSQLTKAVPLRVKQTIVGLIRWHSLSLGVGPDDAKDQSTLNRISQEATRDARVSYDPRAIGDGLTGDRTIDRSLQVLTINPGPWVRRRSHDTHHRHDQFLILGPGGPGGDILPYVSGVV